MAEYIIELPDKLPLKEAPPLQYTGKLVRCKDCVYRCGNARCALHDIYPEYDWYCADGKQKDT